MSAIHAHRQQQWSRDPQHRRVVAGIAASLMMLVTVVASAQVSSTPKTTPPEHEITVPEGLEKITEAAPANAPAADPAAPPTTLNEDDPRNTIVGKVVRVQGSVLTVIVDKQERKFEVPTDARILRDGESVRLNQLVPQDTVRLMTDGNPKRAMNIVAASPTPSSDREPDESLLQRRMADRERERARDEARERQVDRQQGMSTAGSGRVWIVAVDPSSTAAESGIRPGDTIMVVDRNTIQSQNALQGLSGMFPLQSNAAGEVIVGPNSAGVSILGPGGFAIPTGVNVSGPAGVNLGAGTNPNATGANTPPVGDGNFGPPIGSRPNSGDRNFGPSIGTGNAPNAPAGGAQTSDVPPAPSAGAAPATGAGAATGGATSGN